MRRTLFAVIAATCAIACETANSGSGSSESRVVQTEVINPADVPVVVPPLHKDLPTDPPKGPVVLATPDAAPAVTAEGPVGPPATGKLDPGEVELISNGAEPRFDLHYQPTKGAREKLAMTTAMTMTMAPEEPIIFPEMVVEADVAAVDVSAAGAMSLEITLTGADVKDVAGSKIPADQVRSQMGDVVGMKTMIVVDAHGKMTDLKGAAIQQAEQTQMGFNQLAAALPTVPVGKGAKWKVTQMIEQGAMKVKQVITFEILAVTATTAKLKQTGKLTAPRQTIDWQGAKVDLERTTGTANATLTIDFTRLVPEVRGTVEMTMKMNAEGEQATMTTKSVMSMHAK